jgi:prepilin-type N-terminal cleavage/methylation domain-containing protein
MGRKSNTEMTRRGFTLVELMIVMVILGIAAAIVVPMASSAGTLQVRAAGNMVAAGLEYAKSLAISRGNNYAVHFTTAQAYQIEDLSKPVSDPDRIVNDPVKQGSNKYIVNFQTDTRLNQVTMATNFDGGNTVSFNYLGSPFNSGGADLNKGVVTLQAGITKYVVVEPVTGYIHVQDTTP